MGLRSSTVRYLAKFGIRIKRLDEEGKRYLLSSYEDSRPLPVGAQAYLQSNNPALQALHQRYLSLKVAATEHSLWNSSQLKENLALPWFRGDNVYVWQFRQMRSEVRLKQYLALLDIASRDQLELLNTLEEDGLFGCWTFEYEGRPLISRDLLDSVNEINFLEKHIGLTSREELRILDIGAGYGRLAYRMCTALNQVVAYDCVDAVAESTFLCDYYLKYRGANPPAQAVPLDELNRLQASYDLAVNIHSFSECTLSSIEWWLELISMKHIEWLLIVPNEPEELLSMEADGTRKNFMPVVENAGYELFHKQAVYHSKELRDLIGVRDHFFLFRRKDA